VCSSDLEDYAENFQASTGWFKCFKKRFALHNVRVTGEAGRADEDGAQKFVDSLDETGLQWKRMPNRMYIHQEAKRMPGFIAFKDRLTLLLGGNAAGFKLKPFLIYHSENACAFKHINKLTLPVYYHSNPKAWMTQALFENWFINCFIPQASEYCGERGITFKILLVMDNAPGHPQPPPSGRPSA
jgi:hypothetical protein